MKNTPVHRLIEQAEELRLDASSIETLRSQIPRDSKVEAILREAIEGCHARAFTLLSIAALDVEIPVDAGILVHGTRLLARVDYVAKLGAHLSGDVAGALVVGEGSGGTQFRGVVGRRARAHAPQKGDRPQSAHAGTPPHRFRSPDDACRRGKDSEGLATGRSSLTFARGAIPTGG